MPTSVLLYAALAPALLLLTAASVRPSALGRVVTPALGVVGMVTSFFLPQLIALGIATTVVLGLYGALAHPLGWASFGVHVFCWWALGRLIVRMHRAHPVLDGEEVRDSEEPFLTADERKARWAAAGVSWWPSIFLRTAARRQARVERGVVYREVDGRKLRLDIYRPLADAPVPQPPLVYIHGGGWFSGTRRQSRYLMYELAAAGWTVFAVSYRLAPRFPLPAGVEDCKAALAWVRAHAEKYGAGSQAPVVLGGSAGGHLTALVSLTPNLPRFQPGFENAPTDVGGAVVLYGVVDVEGAFGKRPYPALTRLLEYLAVRQKFQDAAELYRALDPMHHAHAAAPPMLFVHGRLDAMVPLSQSQTLAARLREVGADRVHLLEMPYAHHAFEVFPTPLHQRSARVVLAFLDTLRHEERTQDVARAG